MATEKWKQENQDKMKQYRRDYYQRNKESEKERISARTKAIQSFVRGYKITRGCRVCGENHPACLDLHHIDPSLKTINPSLIARQGWGEERIMKELENCEVLCANCHRKEHYTGEA